MTKGKLSVGVILVLFFTTLASAQTITLVMPNNGGNYVKGSDMAVVWKYKNIPDTATVRLVLFQNGQKQAVIKSSEKINDPTILKDNDGYSFGGLKGQWKVGECEGGFSAAPGCNYTIRVVVNNSSGNDYSDKPFCITGSSQSVFKLDSPKGGEKWETGSTQKISWTSINQYSPQVLIKLWKGNEEWGAIIPVGAVKASVQASAGAIDWKVGDNPKNHEFVTAHDYRISVEPGTKVAGGPSIVKSGAFTITVPEFVRIDPNIRGLVGDKWIKVSEPAAGATLTRLKQYRVKWTCSDNLKNTYAKLELWQNGNLIKTYAAKFPLSISGHDLQLFTEIPEGVYTIRIQSLADPAVIGDSGVFHVQGHTATFTHTLDVKQISYGRWGWPTGSGDRKQRCGLPENPAPGVAWAGMARQETTCYWRYCSLLQFDLQGYEGAEVVSARLTWKELRPVSTKINFSRVSSPIGESWDLVLTAMHNFVVLNPNALGHVVQQWIDKPGNNYGILVYGDAPFDYNGIGDPGKGNWSAVHMLTDIKLEVTMRVVE